MRDLQRHGLDLLNAKRTRTWAHDMDAYMEEGTHRIKKPRRAPGRLLTTASLVSMLHAEACTITEGCI